MNCITTFLPINPRSLSQLLLGLVSSGLSILFVSIPASGQVFTHGQLIPTLIPIPNFGDPNTLIPQLVPPLPGNRTCSPFDPNLNNCLNQYRNTTIPTATLRSILPQTLPPTPEVTAAPEVVPSIPIPPAALPAPGTVNQANCPPTSQLVLMPGGYACMQTSR